MVRHILDWCYYGEVLFSRLQGIANQNPEWNGEYLLIRRLRRLIHRALDAGANRGDWTARVVRETRRRARVICIEPDPTNAEYLRRRFGANADVAVHEAALSSIAAVQRFQRGYGSTSGVGHITSGEGQHTIDVRTVSLDALCEQLGWANIDVVKCDIEGDEMSALLGAQRLFRAGLIGVMQVEYNSTWLRTDRRLKELFDFARDHSYLVYAATPWGFTRYARYGLGLEDFRMRNLVVVRPDYEPLLCATDPSGRARVEAARDEPLHNHNR